VCGFPRANHAHAHSTFGKNKKKLAKFGKNFIEALEQSYIVTAFLNKQSEQRRMMLMSGKSTTFAWLFGGIVLLACMYLMMNFIAHPVVLEIA